MCTSGSFWYSSETDAFWYTLQKENKKISREINSFASFLFEQQLPTLNQEYCEIIQKLKGGELRLVYVNIETVSQILLTAEMKFFSFSLRKDEESSGPGQRVDWLASRALGVPRMIASLPSAWAGVQGLAPYREEPEDCWHQHVLRLSVSYPSREVWHVRELALQKWGNAD